MQSIALLLVGTLAVPAAAEDLAAILKRPLSPGALALLIEHTEAAEAHARLREGLGDARPEVRAAASRAIYAGGVTALLPDVAGALGKENEAAVMREHVLAVTVLGPAGHEAVMLGAAKRFPSDHEFLGTLLGRGHGIPGLMLLPALGQVEKSEGLRRTFVTAALRTQPAGLPDAAATVLRLGDATGWRAVWEATRNLGPIGDSVIAQSLASADPRIRATTYWHLSARGVGTLEEPLQKALESAPETTADAATGDADALFASELCSRARGRAPRENRAWAERRGGAGDADLPGAVEWVRPLLTPGEQAFFPSPPKPRRTPWEGLALDAPEPPSLLLVPTDFPRGYVRDLLTVTGCRPKVRSRAAAPVAYDLRGRPRRVPGGTSPYSPECTQYVRLMFASSFAPPDASTVVEPGAPRSVRVLLPDGDDIQCLDEYDRSDARAVGEPHQVGGTFREPKKVHNQPPVYPESAKARREQGMVLLETTIDLCGRVSDMRVLRAPSRELAQAAMNAVFQWRYTPTLLNGKPVPVQMVVTANFKLQ